MGWETCVARPERRQQGLVAVEHRLRDEISDLDLPARILLAAIRCTTTPRDVDRATGAAAISSACCVDDARQALDTPLGSSTGGWLEDAEFRLIQDYDPRKAP